MTDRPLDRRRFLAAAGLSTYSVIVLADETREPVPLPTEPMPPASQLASLAPADPRKPPVASRGNPT